MSEVTALISALAIPLTIIWALWYYRDVIVAALPNVESAFGVKLRQANRAQDAQVDQSPSKIVQSFREFLPSALIEPLAKSMEADIDAEGGSDAKKKSTAIYAAAQAMVILDLEKIYFTIFGTQIYLLRRANESSTGLPNSVAKELYDSAVALNPLVYKDRTFEHWVNYLIVNNLLLDQQGQYLITQKGRVFLNFMNQRGYTDARAF